MVVLGVIVGNAAGPGRRAGRRLGAAARGPASRGRNYSFPAPLKNALDFLSQEWQRKPVGMVGYGMTSSGTRAVAALAPVVVALGMLNVGAVYLPVRRRVYSAGVFRPVPDDDEGLDELLGDVVELATMVRPAPSMAS